jgi:hypothetical protein
MTIGRTNKRNEKGWKEIKVPNDAKKKEKRDDDTREIIPR